MKIDQYFNQNPVFTKPEFIEFLKQDRTHGSVRTPDSLLDYYVMKGRLIRVRRGLYAVVPSGADNETYPVDPYVLASKMTDDSVIAYHSALELYGKHYSVYESLYYLTGKRPRKVTFRGIWFRPVQHPKTLRVKGQESNGVVTTERLGMKVRVTGLDRTLVDVLDRPDLAGSWEEIWRSLESVEFFDLDVVIKYTDLLDNATTAAKVGFFLEQHRDSLMVEDAHLEQLEALRPKQPCYLERGRRESGKLVRRWNLVVPENVLRRVWAEVI